MESMNPNCKCGGYLQRTSTDESKIAKWTCNKCGMKKTQRKRQAYTSQETTKRLVDSLICCYDIIGQDVWGDRTPLQYEFEDVMFDQLRSHVENCNQCCATKKDVDVFVALPRLEFTRLMRRVGP